MPVRTSYDHLTPQQSRRGRGLATAGIVFLLVTAVLCIYGLHRRGDNASAVTSTTAPVPSASTSSPTPSKGLH